MNHWKKNYTGISVSSVIIGFTITRIKFNWVFPVLCKYIYALNAIKIIVKIVTTKIRLNIKGNSFWWLKVIEIKFNSIINLATNKNLLTVSEIRIDR